VILFLLFIYNVTICIKLDPGIHIGKHLIFFGKTGVTIPFLARPPLPHPLLGHPTSAPSSASPLADLSTTSTCTTGHHLHLRCCLLPMVDLRAARRGWPWRCMPGRGLTRAPAVVGWPAGRGLARPPAAARRATASPGFRRRRDGRLARTTSRGGATAAASPGLSWRRGDRCLTRLPTAVWRLVGRLQPRPTSAAAATSEKSPPERRLAPSRVWLEDIATHAWVGIFWSPWVSFRSWSKIATFIGPLLEHFFFLLAFRFPGSF
jgi:hypothetical protein